MALIATDNNRPKRNHLLLNKFQSQLKQMPLEQKKQQRLNSSGQSLLFVLRDILSLHCFFEGFFTDRSCLLGGKTVLNKVATTLVSSFTSS